MLDGLRGEDSIAKMRRREGIASSMVYGRPKEVFEAGKCRLARDTARGEAGQCQRPAPRSASAQEASSGSQVSHVSWIDA